MKKLMISSVKENSPAPFASKCSHRSRDTLVHHPSQPFFRSQTFPSLSATCFQYNGELYDIQTLADGESIRVRMKCRNEDNANLGDSCKLCKLSKYQTQHPEFSSVTL